MLASLLLLQVGLAPVQPGLAGPRTRPAPPPNVLVVLMDDVGVDQVGCYAANYPELAAQPCTPNLDALAATSVRFTNAWASPNCSPARAALQTGRLARHTGVGTITTPPGHPQPSTGLQLDEPTLAKLLPEYASAAVGKWHLSDWIFDATEIQHPLAMGYHAYAGSLYNIETAYDDWSKTLYPEGSVLSHHAVYATVDTTDDALERIATLPEPWLLYVAYNGAHEPLHCPLEQGYPPPPTQPISCTTDWCSDCSALSSPSMPSYPPKAAQSRAVVQALDIELGRLFAAVDRKDTALIVTSDNGTDRAAILPPFSEDRAKGTVYQGGVNVPLLVAIPGGHPGECHELVSFTDVYATVADLARVPLPVDPLRDSVSLMQFLRPGVAWPGLAPRDHVYSEVFGPNFAPEPGGLTPPGYLGAFHHRAVRNATHKLVETRWGDHGAGGGCDIKLEFFQLGDGPLQDPAFGPDPHERRDLMLDPSSWPPATLGAFIELNALLTETYPPLQVGACP